MKNLIQRLSKDIKIHQAGTGSIYVSYQNKKVRIANHEPNRSMKRFRKNADFEIYTHDVAGKLINSKFDVIEKVAAYFNIEIKGTVKAAITRNTNKEFEEYKLLKEIKEKQKKKLIKKLKKRGVKKTS